jgi:Putative zinc finger in N-recognin (UBR box)
MIGYPTNVDQ